MLFARDEETSIEKRAKLLVSRGERKFLGVCPSNQHQLPKENQSFLHTRTAKASGNLYENGSPVCWRDFDRHCNMSVLSVACGKIFFSELFFFKMDKPFLVHGLQVSRWRVTDEPPAPVLSWRAWSRLSVKLLSSSCSWFLDPSQIALGFLLFLSVWNRHCHISKGPVGEAGSLMKC